MPHKQEEHYIKWTKNIQEINSYKIKINTIRSLAINGNSSTALGVAITFLELRLKNTKTKKTKNILNEIINYLKMDEETIDNIIIKNSTIKEDFIDKIVKTIKKKCE